MRCDSRNSNKFDRAGNVSEAMMDPSKHTQISFKLRGKIGFYTNFKKSNKHNSSRKCEVNASNAVKKGSKLTQSKFHFQDSNKNVARVISSQNVS
jgi:hypothetical protein